MTTHQAITKRVHPALHHLIADDTLLSDLGLCQIDLISVAYDLEEAHGFMFDGEPERHWQTVGDVVRAVEAMREGV